MFDLYIYGQFFARTWSLQLTLWACDYKLDSNGFSHYFWPWTKKRIETGRPYALIRVDSIENIKMRTLRQMRKAVS